MAAVGRIARPHGIRGQVIINPDTDFADERFAPGATVFVWKDGAVRELTVTTLRFHRERPIVGFASIDTVNDAETLAGLELRVPIERLVQLPGGTFYRHDLVGCRVETADGAAIGTVEEVEGGAGGSRLVVASPRGEVLIPLAADICTAIEPARKRIVVSPPAGLLEVNERGRGTA